jgi:hypothetical protein
LRFDVSRLLVEWAALDDLIMARDYRPLDRDQLFLLPPDMKLWLR